MSSEAESLLTLIALSAISGALASIAFRTLAPRQTSRTMDRILAHLMELRLFIDEPALLFQAQRGLFRENIRLIGQIALPGVLSAILFGLIAWQLDPFNGRGALRAGEAAVATASMPSAGMDLQLEAPAGVDIETPGVRITSERQVSWRIRPEHPFSGTLVARTADGSRFPVTLDHPRARILGLDWLVWFFGLSSLFALVTPKLAWKRMAASSIVFVFIAPYASAADRPPVILISIDTLRADHVSAFGYSKLRTTGIDAYAEHGTIFTQIDSQIPLTLPSHTVLMTSSYPFVTGVESNTQSVPQGALTIASVLRRNGYATGAFIGSFILDQRFGLDQGFDFYDSPFASEPASTANPYAARVRRDASLVLRAARQWMTKNSGKPAFVFIHLFDLHTPYPTPGVAGLMPNTSGYDTQLARVDRALATFRDQLIRDGWWDKSLVVLLSDHGEGLGDHGESSHGYFLYESTIHVPLIIHWPSLAPLRPASVSAPGGLIDVAPTMLDFLGISPPASFAGVSLLGDSKPHIVFSESVYPRDTFGWAALRSLREGSNKLIDAPRPELYNLNRDPAERSNVLPEQKSEASILYSRLATILNSKPVPRASGAPEITAQTRDLLRSLGYTAGSSSTKATGIDPKDRIAEQERYEKGLALLYTGDLSGAIQILGRVTRDDPANLPALSALGEAHLRAGNTSRALQLWQQALNKNPRYRPAAESIGGYWLSKHDYDKACDMIPTAQECVTRQSK